MKGKGCIQSLAKANPPQSSDSSPFYTTCKLVEGIQYPVVQVIQEDIEPYWPQHQPLECTAASFPPAGLCVTG